MGDDQGLIFAWPLLVGDPRVPGRARLALVMGEFLSAALVAGTARVFGRYSLLVWLLAAVLFMITLVDLGLWLSGLGSALELLTG